MEEEKPSDEHIGALQRPSHHAIYFVCSFIQLIQLTFDDGGCIEFQNFLSTVRGICKMQFLLSCLYVCISLCNDWNAVNFSVTTNRNPLLLLMLLLWSIRIDCHRKSRGPTFTKICMRYCNGNGNFTLLTTQSSLCVIYVCMHVAE